MSSSTPHPPFRILVGQAPPALAKPFLPPTVDNPDSPPSAALAAADEALVTWLEEAQAGSLESFGQVVTHFETRVLHYLQRFTQNAHDAEDLTQETFVKAFRNLSSFDARRPFSAWIFTIARRTAISHFRGARFRTFEPAETAREQTDPTDPAQSLASKDERRSLWELANRLKPQQREALWLHYAEDLSILECARVMGLTQIHVKILLYRGRQALARLLEHHPLASNESRQEGQP